MKNVKFVLFAIPFVILLALQSFQVNKIGDDKSSASGQKLKKYSITLGAQSNKTNGGFINLSQGEVLRLPGVFSKQNDIDFIYAFGQSTGINLIVPSSGRLNEFSSYKKDVVGKWSVLNKGSFINLKQSKSAKQLFKKVKTNDQLVNSYKESQKSVKSLPDYKLLTHGPAASLRGMQVGDIFLFKSAEKNIHAIGRVVSATQGFSGEILIDLKVAGE